jgi:metallo-beta-lactamase family protein
MSVTLQFLGGAGTVTGSSHLISTDKAQILLDAGLFQGHRDESYQLNSTFAFNPRKIKAMVLSHAHIDHCGNIPTLIQNGLRKVYATAATKDLAKVMLEDSGKIQEEDIQYVNKINRRLGLPGRKPLYTEKDATRATKIFRPLSYGQRFCIAKDSNVSLFDAGHILGSAIVVLDIKENEKSLRIGYAVDLGRKDLPLINNPRVPQGLDYLILESTYGGREHSPVQDAKNKLREVILRTHHRRGKIIIPAFSLERTQEVLYFLNELVKAKEIPALPIYVDSPLATEITKLFVHHLSYLNVKTRQAIEESEGPFEFINLRYTKNQEESKKLNDDKQPMIIIAGSGMCESGRIQHHLKNTIEDSRNTVMVVGYMARDTLGRKLIEKDPVVRIFGVEYEVHAEVVVINSFSGHADKNELVEFVSECLPLKKIFLVHGEEDQLLTLNDTLSRMGLTVHIGRKNEEVLLE